MLPLAADNLSIVSTILCCATRTQSWNSLGTSTASTQEEIQMMRIGDAFFIACNHGGHSCVTDFLNAFRVHSAESLVNSVKWCHLAIDSLDRKAWNFDDQKRSKYSDQESKTLGLFPFPADIPKTATATELGVLERCVGKDVPSKPDQPEDWMTGVLQQLLGVYSTSKKKYRKTYPAPTDAANFGAVGLNGTANLNLGATLITDSSKVHAELKLLALLTKMIIDGKVQGGADVYLGGLKAACKSCDGWITSYRTWLTGRTVTLHLPDSTNRTSATAGVWNKPKVDQDIKSTGDVIATIPDLFQ